MMEVIPLMKPVKMFSVEETAVSSQMGLDKVERHMKTGARFITGPDCSCLMHMAGVAKKRGLV